MIHKLLVISGVLLLACVLVPLTPAQNTLNRGITLRVKDASLAVPGGVLDPGTYHMQFVGANYDKVLISREDGTTVGLFPVRPSILPETSDKIDIVIGRLPDGSQALSKFFYPGEPIGYRFEYPGAQPALLANKQAPASATVAHHR
jgi:hypothetical protein